jgi:hypothetical protein
MFGISCIHGKGADGGSLIRRPTGMTYLIEIKLTATLCSKEASFSAQIAPKHVWRPGSPPPLLRLGGLGELDP